MISWREFAYRLTVSLLGIAVMTATPSILVLYLTGIDWLMQLTSYVALLCSSALMGSYMAKHVYG